MGSRSPCLASSIIRLAMTSTAGSLGRSVNPKARRQSSNATVIAFSRSGENELCSIIQAPAPQNHYGSGNLLCFRAKSRPWFPVNCSNFFGRKTSHWRERHGLPRNADRPQILLSSLTLSTLAPRFESRFSLRARFSDNGTLERSFSTSSQKHCERLAYRGRVFSYSSRTRHGESLPEPDSFWCYKRHTIAR